ncbi:MAG: hypothetical protein ABFE07_29470 [Armatimonadia bacterium]
MPRLKANSYVGMRMENELLEEVKAFARDHQLGLSAAMRQLMLAGLELQRRAQAERTRKLVGTLKRSVGEFFQLKAVGDSLTLERVTPKVISLGSGKSAKKEVVHA